MQFDYLMFGNITCVILGVRGILGRYDLSLKNVEKDAWHSWGVVTWHVRKHCPLRYYSKYKVS